MNFNDLGLSAPILQAVAEEGYEQASPIQQKAIPAVLAGKDVMAAAQTGTGKTAGFTLPILALLEAGEPASANNVRTLILTPTRELAAQVGASVETYGKYLKLRSNVVFGGVKINPQMMKLRRGTDILVATPGRLLDLYQQNAVKFSELKVLVLDEADRMLDMGFIHDIKKILNLLPKKRQNLMFSATFSPEIRELAKGLMDNPLEISVSQPNSTASGVNQWMCPVDKAQKPDVLIELISKNKWRQVLVFTRTKHGANKLTRQLDDAGITAAAIHGNKSQGARTRALEEFKAQQVRVLVATDIAARGLDIDQLPQVVNFDLPNVAEDYVHRIGRTGRAGATGQAVSLVSADEHKQLVDIEKLIKHCLPRKPLDGYEPNHDVPASNVRPKPTPAAPRNQNARGGAGRQADSRRGEARRGDAPKSDARRGEGRRGEGRSEGRSGNTQERPRSAARPGRSTTTSRPQGARQSSPGARDRSR